MATPFGKYELVTRLARGGMGETYLAEFRAAAGVKKRVVIKKMLRGFLDDPAMRDAFVEEARLSATLSHGNIAQVFDFGEVEGEYFIAMEYVHGRSLAAVLKRAAQHGWDRLPVPVSVYVTIELLKALHYAHTRRADDGAPLNLVHRDVSPENVLLGFDGEVKLVDFGIAKTSEKGRTQTEPGLVKGKERYFSPEQALGRPLDAGSDLFSTGVVLYELLTASAPFAGSGHELMYRIVNDAPAAPRVLQGDLPDALEAAVMRALEKQRGARFDSALTMQEVLMRWLFARAPDFTAEVVREVMGILYEEELRLDGAPFVPRPRATRMLKALISDAQTSPRRALATKTVPPRRRRGVIPAVLGVAFIAGLGATVMLERRHADDEAGGHARAQMLMVPPPPTGVARAPRIMQLATTRPGFGVSAGCRGMTWVVLNQKDGLTNVGSDRKLTDAYQGDTSCDTALPILCISLEGLQKPPEIVPDFYNGWTGGRVAVTAPILGAKLESRASADSVCALELGAGWRMAEHHDGHGWGFWAYGTPPRTRFWVAINDQRANPWSLR